MNEIKGIRIVSLTGEKEYGIEDSEVREELANVVDGAPEELDSFKEAFEKFKKGGEALAGIAANVAAVGKAVADETERAQSVEQVLDGKIGEEVRRAVIAERGIEAKALDASSAKYEATENAVVLKFATIEGTGDEAVIPAATTEKAGVMSAGDKRNLDNVPNTINDAISEEAKATDVKIAKERTRAEQVEQTLANDIANAPNLALRALFVAAGAEYNDTDNVIMKTAPWGDSVEHLPKHYYLNGLGDITENEMSSIYVNSPNVLAEFAYAEKKHRTFIFNAGTSSASLRNYISGLFCNCSMAETIGDGKFIIHSGVPSNHIFYRCARLKHINAKAIYGFGNMSFLFWFSGCTALITCKITRLAVDVSFLDSPNISYDSILYIINNIESTLKKSITITLHHDAYARLTANSNIVAALDAKNTLLASQGGKVSLVCAIHNEEKIPNA